MMASNKQQQTGVSLVELMVGLVVGLLVTLAVSALYVRASAMASNQSQNAEIRENARFAIGELGRVVRQAAFVGQGGGNVVTPLEMRIDPVRGEMLTVRYLSNSLKDVDGDTVATMADCAGNSVASQNVELVNTFFIDTDRGVRKLMCESSTAGTPTTTVVVADNVEALRLMAGYARTGDGCVFDRYVLPGQVPPAGPLVSLRLGLLLRSAQAVPLGDRPAVNNFALLGPEVASGDVGAEDLAYSGAYQPEFSRQIVETTFYLRNRCEK